MPDIDLTMLFPSEQPAAPAQPVQRADKADAAALLFGDAKPAQPPAAPRSGDPIRAAFPSEAAPDPAKAVADTMTPWADSLKADGNAERAEEMRAVSDALAQDFRDTGMTADDVSEVMGLAREALGNSIMPGFAVSDERLAEMRTVAEAFIAENQINADDISLAQRLVSDLDAKTGGRVSEYLINSGMGNDPRAIERAVQIARRRYAR